MTCNIENNQFDSAMELLIANGFNGIADAVSILMSNAMQIERSRYLKAEPYEPESRLKRTLLDIYLQVLQEQLVSGH